MKNKNLRTTLILITIISCFTMLLITITNYNSINRYNYNNDLIISTIISSVKEKYPDITEDKIIELLNNKELTKDNNFKNYGIYIEDSLSIANDQIKKRTLTYNIIIFSTYILLLIIIILLYNRNNNKKIKEITNYLKEINNNNYDLDIDSNNEDELSLLKNEIYKTAIMLNETSSISKKDKESLKDSLSDISHQLKTPLTSINLMIDNLDNKNLSTSQRKELIMNIKRKINSVNFLVQSLLKLSKFDANTISFVKKKIKVNEMLEEVKDNLSALADLKNISINIKGSKEVTLQCDYKWQVEALTNIVKNCLEYSNYDSKIDISYESNDIFTKIVIQDSGIGMTLEDQKHIFERFYKGKNSSSDNVGIGLALAKTIIEKENGNISVSSKINKGTTFTIKYIH